MNRGDRARSGTPLVIGGLALAVAGVALLVAPEERVAADTGSVLGTPAAPPTPAPALPSRTSTTATDPATAPPTAAAAPGFSPERLVVDALALDAPLVTTVVDSNGAFVPPEDPDQLGWWRGVRPGEGEGSVVMAGHIDSRRFGQGPLSRIVDLRPGDRAVVLGAGGSAAEYVVRGIQTFPKESFPATELFSSTGPERLVLVTCGGTFDRDVGHWDSNVVAVLDPADPAPPG